MTKTHLTLAVLVAAALTSHAQPLHTQDACSKGCDVVYLTVPNDGKVGQKVVRDREGRCWQSTFDLVPTQEPNVMSQRMLSKQVPIHCGKTPG